MSPERTKAPILAALGAALAPCLSAQEPAFPASNALAEEVSPEALARLDALVQELVDADEVVGAELLVVKNGRSLLHEAYGWRDREAALPMRTGSVFCVRSMTKPLIGASILMLLEQDLIELDDPIARYLPAFDTDTHRGITVEQLLTHTSGLPMSHIASADPRELESVRAVAELGATHPLEHEPGSVFEYSDQGTDTLTALIEVVTGRPAEEFVTTRLLEPLGMESSTCLLPSEHALRARACSKYVGSTKNWTRYWNPDEQALFPIFLGSQALYSTVADYALFLEAWMHTGRGRDGRLVKPRWVRKMLKPGPYSMDYPTGFPDTSVQYGMLMQLWTRDEDGERELVAFGHTGSDGTYAWAFPEQRAMVLYFTQSRNNTTGLRMEELLAELFLGAPYDPAVAAPPLDDYLGYYREDESDLYRAVVRDGDGLALEIMGKAVVALTFAGDDRWKMRDRPNTVLAFQRSPEGRVTGYRIDDHEEFRFTPAADLPSADEVAERVVAAHRIDHLQSLGGLRVTFDLEVPKVGVSGETVALYAWPNRYRLETRAGEEHETIAYDGESVTYRTRQHGLRVLEGARREVATRDSLLVRLGDWRESYERLEVVQRLEKAGEEILVVRAGDATAPAPTFYVHAPTGRVLAEDRVVEAEMLGRIGQHVELNDYREVEGMLLPHRVEVELANPMIGSIVTTVREIEVGADVTEATFRIEE